MALSNSVLAFLLAIVSVLSLSLPSIIPLFRTPDSSVELSHPVVRGNTVFLMATNSGERPGVIEAAAIEGKIFRMTVASVDPVSPADAFVRPGSQQVRFKITLSLSYLDALNKALESHLAAERSNAPFATIKIQVRQARGKIQILNFDLSGHDTFEIFKAHAEACEAQKANPEPTGACQGIDELRAQTTRHFDETIAKLRGVTPKSAR